MQPKKSSNEVNKKNIPTTVQLSSVINLLVQNVVQENDIIRSQRMHKQYTLQYEATIKFSPQTECVG
ncbi:hypothetical protein T12_7396 [Trichinella patagoniensis]|uniref:Uncharacterized protein n=1 Tax=Trichinella patagoniensis TaxID=990121 RepID=A0A0V0ZW59_9BILA|nr:hypothetical protein T12_7396 [Trichinella patagoniensis]